MIGVSDGVRRVFVRRLDRAEAIELPGTVGANGVGVLARRRERGGRLSVGAHHPHFPGGPAAQGPDVWGRHHGVSIAWSQAGIIFGRGGALWIVSPEGGAPRALTVLDAARHEVAHDSAGGAARGAPRAVCESDHRARRRAHRIRVDRRRTAVGGGRASDDSRMVAHGPSALLAGRCGAGGGVRPAHGNAARRGRPGSCRAGAIEGLASGQLALTLSSTGTLLFAPVGFTDTRVVSVSRDGAALALDLLPSSRYANPRISPDGRRLLVEIGGNVIEALDLARGTRARLTAATLSRPLHHVERRRDTRRVPAVRRAVLGGRRRQRRLSGPCPDATVNDFPSSPGPDPDSFITLRITPETSGDVFLMSMSGAFEPKPLIVTPAYEGGAQLSPDGRWLLYQSDASGRAEIYVRRYPALDRQWQVSDGGGVQARWSRNNREIYYRSGGRIVAASPRRLRRRAGVRQTHALCSRTTTTSARAPASRTTTSRADGRFIMIRRGANGGKLRVVVNWTEELKQILASGGIR